MKTAFVTGGSRGIGRSIALDLGKKFHVIVGFSVSNDKAEEVSEKIISNGGSSSTVQIDISKSDSVDAAFSSIFFCLLDFATSLIIVSVSEVL